MTKNARVIAVATQKGGVGKTTTVTNMSVGLASLGYKTAAIDMASQGNLAITFGINKHELKETVFDVLIGNVDMKEIRQLAYGVDLYLANHCLSNFVDTVLGPENEGLFPNTKVLLKQSIDQIRTKYDYILIDTPSSMDLLNINALVASTDVIIPIQPDRMAVESAYNLIEVVKKLQKQGLGEVKVLGILATIVQSCTLHKVILQDLRKTHTHSDIKVFETVIKREIKHVVAQCNGVPDINKAPEYLAFIKEALALA